MPHSFDDQSDYTKIRTDLTKLLPTVHSSDLTTSVIENTFNRFLTKEEIKRIAGFIGQKSPQSRALVNRQIQEPTPHRQAFQLQPILYSKIGTIEHMASWIDLLNEFRRLGIDTDKLKEWGNAVQFNWAPPIDLDKIAHFVNYYWYDPDNPSSLPQYLTIKSKCSTALARLRFWEKLMTDYGSTIPIFNVFPATDEIMVNGNFTELFEPGFVFFVKNTTNIQLNNSFFLVDSSTFDSPTSKTRIKLKDFNLTNSINGGVISLEEQYITFLAIKQCKCDGGIGWDLFPWDDNPDAWHEDLINNISFPTELAWNTAVGNMVHPFHNEFWEPDAPGFPVGGAVLSALWYDTSNNQLKQYNGSAWIVIRNNFSFILSLVTGVATWDAGTGCGIDAVIPAAEQWIRENRWVHKSSVDNFGIARRAVMPIIEFLPNLELNEWAFTDHIWKYREDKFKIFADIGVQPSLFELQPLEKYTRSGNTIMLDPVYGDLTPFFTTGIKFLAFGLVNIFEVVRSRYQRSTPSDVYQTVIDVDDASALPLSHTQGPLIGPDVPGSLRPQKTSQGHVWRAYHEHWLYVGQKATVPINHQPINPYVVIPDSATVTPTVSWNYTLSRYAQSFNINIAGITSLDLHPSLRDKAIVGAQDIRVYINGVRSYGSFEEQNIIGDPTDTRTIYYNFPPFTPLVPFTSPVAYVDTLLFSVPFTINDLVLVEVGEAALSDFGNATVPVRTIEDETAFSASAGPEFVSLIKYHKFEQIKTALNQYPLFDMYNMDGTTAFAISPIFSFLESQDAPIFAPIGRRIVRDAAAKDFSFQQHLVLEDGGPMFGYRDYDLQDENFWFNQVSMILLFWNGLTWAPRDDADNILLTGFVGPLEPPSPGIDITGQYWFDTQNKVLKVGNYSSAMMRWTWVVEPDVKVQTSDPTIQSIWKVGLNKEEYIPSYVDRERRADGDIVLDSEGNPVVVNLPIGSPLGEWEIPDQLYFNHLHENRVILTFRELFAHFNDIIQSQPDIPGFSGSLENQWHLVDYEDINYGLGGKIKEFNDGFDTLLSSTFNNNVTPLGIIEFAQDRYESALNAFKEIFLKNIVGYLLNTSAAFILDLSTQVSEGIINSHEENDFLTLVFGDSPTFNDVTDVGIRNFIATLPYIFVVRALKPEALVDLARDINELTHHDGHRHSYSFVRIISEGIILKTIRTPDPRTVILGPNPDPQRTFGRRSTTLLPPNTRTQHESVTYFDWPILNGVYWYYAPPVIADRTLYRLTLASVGPTTPSAVYPDGTLWFDTLVGLGTLRIKSGISWIVVPGNALGDGKLHNGTTVLDATISAWQPVDINAILTDVILEVEQRLFANAPNPYELVFNFTTLTDTPAELATYNEYLLDAFLDFARESDIIDPFLAIGHFVATDPFTWNYKHFLTPPLTPKGTPYVSGGDWRDLYEKLLGTPYPHLEPWKLQSYKDKPDWWDARYKVTDPLGIFGDRRWKYIHELPITVVGPTQFNITGDYTGVFTPGVRFSTRDISLIYQQWTVMSSALFGPTTTVTVTTPINPLAVFAFIGMWENIRIGAIPAGEIYPNGVTSIIGFPPDDNTINGLDAPNLPTFNYFCVNIRNNPFTLGPFTFQPDDVFPPILNQLLPVGEISRTIFTSNAFIVAESADYAFLDAGPVEWIWRNSSQYLYDQLKIAFRMQPMRLFNSVFGTEFYDVACLQVDRRTDATFAHNRTKFHGDIISENTVYSVNGMNQWYVNFNRFNGFDTTFSDFKGLWVDWVAPMMYQFSSFVDTESVELSQRFIQISDHDFNIAIKKSPGVEDYWLNSLRVTVVNTPPSLVRVDNEHEWTFMVDTPSPLNQEIIFYGAHFYQFYADPLTDICTLFTYPIIAVDTTNDTFSVKGDQTEVFVFDRVFDINGSTGNDGSYSVLEAVFDAVANKTIISVTSVASLIVDGLITADFRKLPWETGHSIWFSTNEVLPVPIKSNLEYFVIKLSPNQFQIANTPTDAITLTPMDLTTTGEVLQYVGELFTTFNALGARSTNHVFRQYAIDKEYIVTAKPPFQTKGIQTVINMIAGYALYTDDIRFRINYTKILADFDTNRQVDWQIELERFLDFIFQLRIQRKAIGDRFEVSVNDVNNEWNFEAELPGFVTGDRIKVFSSGVIPDPLIFGIDVYMIRDSENTFRLAATQRDASLGNEIDILFTPNLGRLFLIASKRTEMFPVFEINPFRNAIWYAQERGIVSDIVIGPVVDVRAKQLIFDQYGRQLLNDNLRIFRQDRLTQIRVADEIINDVEGFKFNIVDAYNFIHIGGVHLFIDAYEHVLKFNNYTTEGCLIYDPFIGLNVTQFNILFDRNPDFTLRPNLGGYYLVKQYDQGADAFSGQMLRNIEASIEDMRFYYDTFITSEPRITTRHARAAVDYRDSAPYLDEISINRKSQFLFYKGLLQYKGSNAAVRAFVNSKRFIGASVDEFWALKIAEFGSAYDQEFPELYLTTRDARGNEIKFEFIENSMVVPDSGFTGIAMTDQTRWYEQPDQLRVVADDGQTLFFETTPTAGAISDFIVDFATIAPLPAYTGIGVLTAFPAVPGALTVDGASMVLGAIILVKDETNQARNGVYEVTDDGSGLFPWELTRARTYDTEDEIKTHTHIRVTLGSVTNVWQEFALTTTGQIIVETTELEYKKTGRFNGLIDGFYFIRHNTKSDALSVLVDWKEPNFKYDVLPGDVSGPVLGLYTIILPSTASYIPQANSITVVMDGVKLVSGVDYFEPSFASILPSIDTLTITTNRADFPITILYGTATLVDGVHFERTNSNIVKFLSNEITTAKKIFVYGITPNKNAHNPSKLIDKQAETVTATLQIWDPARGSHYRRAIHEVDIQNDTDQAFYKRTLDQRSPTNVAVGFEDPPTNLIPIYTPGDNFWNTQEEGTVWLDTNVLDYIPYYDDKIFPNVDDRLKFWGKLAEWAEVKMYEWVRSDVLPSDYNTFAENQSLDTTIPEEIRASGIAKRCLFRTDPDDTTASVGEKLNTIVEQYDALFDGVPVPGGYEFTLVEILPELFDIINTDVLTDSIKLTGNIEHLFGADAIFNIVGSTGGQNDGLWKILEFTQSTADDEDTGQTTLKIERVVPEVINLVANPATVSGPNQFTIAGFNFTGTFLAGFTFEDQTAPTPNKYTTVSSTFLVNTIITVVETTVALPTVFLATREIIHTPVVQGQVEYFQNINIYVNGLTHTIGLHPQSSTIFVSGVRPIDRITFVQPISTYEAIADDEIAAGRMQRDYEYSVVEKFDATVNANISTYYFWVENKTLKNRKDISLTQAVQELADIPEPYILFQKPLAPKEITVNDVLYRLPYRYVQLITRGLRGIVDDERRYVLRFTRDFTLRDSLDVGRSALELKNLHTQWELFREEQPNHPKRELWDKITESIVGFKLTDPATPVPSLDRVLYDQIFVTDTRFGLGEGQAFVDGTIALNTVIQDLESPDNDFTPTDINVFFENNDFDTPENIIAAMNTIYNTFHFRNVNRILFSVLHDAFAGKKRFAEIFKTSYVALHGIRLLEVGGLFDD